MAIPSIIPIVLTTSMLSVDQAERIITNLIQPLTAAADSESLDLMQASGRVLAEDVVAHLDVPHWNNSAMDGYAVRYEDIQSSSIDHPITLEVVEEIPAGYQPTRPIGIGQAARILTGSVMPSGADTVVMQEETRRSGNQVTILTSSKPGTFVRRQGDYYRAGTTLLPAGTVLQAPEIAVLAAAQCAQVKVLRQLRVAILSTGNELVTIDQTLQPGQIVDSNQYALATLVAQTGAIPICLGIVPDQPEVLKQVIQEAIATADVVLSSGGVSVGDYDYVDGILESLGGTFHIRSVAMKPGKPLTVVTIQGGAGQSEQRSCLYFGLPGNPVSALVTFWRFVQPALRQLAGMPSPFWKPVFVNARSRVDLRSDGKRESYLWGRLLLVNGAFEFDLAAGKQVSGNLINLAGTNGLAVLPVGTTQIAAGEMVQVMQVGLPGILL